jgi:fluoride exporter
VNVLGCLIIGVVFGLSERFDWMTPEWRFFLATGFCGGFTTFSAFALENIILLQNRDYFTFAIYAVLSFALCLAAAFTGLLITRG